MMGKAAEVGLAAYISTHSPWGLLWLGKEVKGFAEKFAKEWKGAGNVGLPSLDDVAQSQIGKNFENLTAAQKKAVSDIHESLINPKPRETPQPSGEPKRAPDWWMTPEEKARKAEPKAPETPRAGPIKAPIVPSAAGPSMPVPEGVPEHYGESFASYGEKIGYKHAPVKDATIIEHLQKANLTPDAFEKLPLTEKNKILKEIKAPNKKGRFDPWTNDAEGANSIKRLLRTWRSKQQ
jgi:hypothetical protein